MYYTIYVFKLFLFAHLVSDGIRWDDLDFWGRVGRGGPIPPKTHLLITVGIYNYAAYTVVLVNIACGKQAYQEPSVVNTMGFCSQYSRNLGKLAYQGPYWYTCRH